MKYVLDRIWDDLLGLKHNESVRRETESALNRWRALFGPFTKFMLDSCDAPEGLSCMNKTRGARRLAPAA